MHKAVNTAVIEEFYVEPETKIKDGLLILKKLNAYLQRVNFRKERIVVLIALEDVERIES